MLHVTPFVLLWLVAGLAAGEMVIDGALSMLEQSAFSDNTAAVLLLFTLSAIIALPWLIWRAADEAVSYLFRR